MTRTEAHNLKAALQQSPYVEYVKTHRETDGYSVEFAEGGCWYRLDTLAQAIRLGFYK